MFIWFLCYGFFSALNFSAKNKIQKWQSFSKPQIQKHNLVAAFKSSTSTSAYLFIVLKGPFNGNQRSSFTPRYLTSTDRSNSSPRSFRCFIVPLAWPSPLLLFEYSLISLLDFSADRISYTEIFFNQMTFSEPVISLDALKVFIYVLFSKYILRSSVSQKPSMSH